MINVKDFGAKGDGKADDWDPIQRAVYTASATGEALFFPPGTYRLKQQVKGVSLVAKKPKGGKGKGKGC